MIKRAYQKQVADKLRTRRVVVLKGLPRVGRSSLARSLANDLTDVAFFIPVAEYTNCDPHLFCASHRGRILVLDGVRSEHVHGIAEIIRAAEFVDAPAPRFLLVVCDAIAEQSLSGSLTGIFTDIELPPIQVFESFSDSRMLQSPQGPFDSDAPIETATNSQKWSQDSHWLRGGLPESLTADSDKDSFEWRKDYISALLGVDFTHWSIDPSDRLPDVLQWIANNNGEQFNEGNCGTVLSLKKESIRRSLDLLVKLGLLRRLENWPAKSNQSLKSMPVYHARDSGLLHAMLGIDTIEKLRANDSRGHSWESFAIEALVNSAPTDATPAFFRDIDQNEIDLVLSCSNGSVFAVEFKTNETKGVEKGFALACEKIGATHKMVVHAGEADHQPASGIQRLSLMSAIQNLHRSS